MAVEVEVEAEEAEEEEAKVAPGAESAAEAGRGTVAIRCGTRRTREIAIGRGRSGGGIAKQAAAAAEKGVVGELRELLQGGSGIAGR